jgi:hypothetical protein
MGQAVDNTDNNNNSSAKDLDEFSDTGFSMTSEEARHWEQQLLDNNNEQQTVAAQAAMEQENQQVFGMESA